jgi:hypothetical protein
MRLVPAAVLAALPAALLVPAAGGPAVARPVEAESRLDVLAQVNSTSVERVERMLRDVTVRVTASGHLYYVDPAPQRAERESRGTTAAPRGPFPQARTFQLHSKPGSQRTIYLDFTGHTVADTHWNTSRGGALANGEHPAWDPADNGETTWSTSEHDLVQSIWQRVAEDYAPFDVDVTTEDPGQAAITRSGAGDQVYGTRALVTPSETARQALCDLTCVGIAMLDVFDRTSAHAEAQPAWIFPQAYGADAKGIAETISHEVGHQLDLEHDTHDASGVHTEYYEGHAHWAPIMGNSDLQPISQWSRGGYAGAGNTQDDVAAIAARTGGHRADEAGATVATAVALPETGTAGYVTTRADVDVYELGTCSGSVTVTASVASVSPNLDARLRILDGTGAQVAVAEPASTRVSADVANGLSATISTSLAAGTYHAEVDGDGAGSAATSYDDYGSLGAYTLDVTGCVDDASVPSAPRSLSATATSATAATVTWDAPASEGVGPVTGYRLVVDGGALTDLPTTARSTEVTGLGPGTHTVRLRAVNASGQGPVAQTTVTVGTEATAPGAVRSLQARVTGRRVDVSWQPPASDGGRPVTGYRVRLSGLGQQDFGSTTNAIFATGLVPGTTYTAAVTARNEVGTGTTATATFRVPGAPGAPLVGSASSGARGGSVTAVARWQPPRDSGGASVTGYQVVAYEQGGRRRVLTSPVLSAGARSAVLQLPPGRFRFAVKARNVHGWGRVSGRSGAVVAR